MRGSASCKWFPESLPRPMRNGNSVTRTNVRVRSGDVTSRRGLAAEACMQFARIVARRIWTYANHQPTQYLSSFWDATSNPSFRVSGRGRRPGGAHAMAGTRPIWAFFENFTVAQERTARPVTCEFAEVFGC